MIYRVKINDIECEFDEKKDDLTILQACLANGIEIPRFCYHEKLTIAGNCRMCLVYVTNEEKLLAACGIPLDEEFDDESIETEIDEILKAREGVMEFLLINHPLDCPICDQGGECDLQEQTINYGLDTGRFYIKKRAVEIKNFGKLIKGIMTRCIHCTRCVRFLTEIAGVHELGILGRGYNMEIGTYKQDIIIESEISGNIIDLCPVGALTSATYAYKGRPWELKSVKSIDIFDSLLTSINFQVKGGEIFRVLPKINDKLNEEWITDKIRFHYESYKIVEKLRQDKPTYKIHSNVYVELSWKSAINLFFKIILNRANNLDIILGMKLNFTSISIYKKLMTLLGNKNLYMESNLNLKKFNYDFRENYINSNDLSNLQHNDLALLIGINLRLENPLLNIKLRNLNFNDDDIDSGKNITIIGNKFEWRSDSSYLGSKLKTILNILEGRHYYCKHLQKSKNPIIICGSSLLMRLNLSMQDLRAFLKAKMNINENNILYITSGANTVMAFEQGIFTEYKGNFKNNNILYGIDATEIKLNSKPMYMIYQGIITDYLQNDIDLYLPIKYYFEDFLEERTKYLNIFGKVCELEKLQLTIKNKIKETVLIGYIQLHYLNGFHGLKTQEDIKDIAFSSYAKKITYQKYIKINKYLTLNNIIDNYYKTDILSRFSKNLMITSKGRIEDTSIERSLWKKKNTIS